MKIAVFHVILMKSLDRDGYYLLCFTADFFILQSAINGEGECGYDDCFIWDENNMPFCSKDKFTEN